MSKTDKRFREFRVRRAERMAAQGIKLEKTVEKILARMRDENKISSFVRHEHHSTEDRDGKDFTVIYNAEVSCSFGVTISPNSWHKGKLKHREVTQFCWPIGTNTETMERRILELASKK